MSLSEVCGLLSVWRELAGDRPSFSAIEDRKCIISLPDARSIDANALPTGAQQSIFSDKNESKSSTFPGDLSYVDVTNWDGGSPQSSERLLCSLVAGLAHHRHVFVLLGT